MHVFRFCLISLSCKQIMLHSICYCMYRVRISPRAPKTQKKGKDTRMYRKLNGQDLIRYPIPIINVKAQKENKYKKNCLITLGMVRTAYSQETGCFIYSCLLKKGCVAIVVRMMNSIERYYIKKKRKLDFFHIP